MRKAKQVVKPSIWKYLVQCLFIVLFGYMFIIMVALVFDEVTDDYRSDKSLQSQINRGDYADFWDYYYVLRYVEDLDGNVFDKYKEFANFYKSYNSYTQYTISYNNLGEKNYKNKASEYLEVMEHILENSEYYDNIPHYEYLLDTLNQP